MNEFEAITASQIERLVDGELSSSERRTVLMSLDQETDGWRRVALAFLESQAMRDSLRPRSVVELPQKPEPVFPAEPKRLPTRPLALLKQWAPLTAVCLLTFSLGRLSLPSRDTGGRPVRPTYASGTPAESEGQGNPGVLVTQSGQPGIQRQQTLRLELSDESGGPSQSVEVPVVEDRRIRVEDLLEAPSVIPDSVQRALLRSGRRVHEQRQLYEVTLQDGRQGVVPVNEVLVENAGLDVYQ